VNIWDRIQQRSNIARLSCVSSSTLAWVGWDVVHGGTYAEVLHMAILAHGTVKCPCRGQLLRMPRSVPNAVRQDRQHRKPEKCSLDQAVPRCEH
jgi:hypothetical protein